MCMVCVTFSLLSHILWTSRQLPFLDHLNSAPLNMDVCIYIYPCGSSLSPFYKAKRVYLGHIIVLFLLFSVIFELISP